MAKVLYREYRPDVFEDVIGQEAVKTALQRALSSGRLGHAYLFSGPRGCGKTTSARIFARCLNCVDGPTPTPCGKCESCKELGNGCSGSLDVIEMDAASHRGIEDARDLRERIEYAPNRDRFKVVILDEAHMITGAAFNALLKVVEEPPEHVKFIFATTEPENVIPTIRSRTYNYTFSLVPSEIMTPFLHGVCEKEKIELEERVYPLVVRIGAGSVRDTLSSLDQLLAGSKEGKVDYEFAVNLLGFTPMELIYEAVDSIAANNFASLYEVAESLINKGISPKGFMLDLVAFLRDALLVGFQSTETMQKNSTSVKAALGERSDSELKKLGELASNLGTTKLTQIINILFERLNTMVGATSERLVLELAIAGVAELAGNGVPPAVAIPTEPNAPVAKPASKPPTPATPPVIPTKAGTQAPAVAPEPPAVIPAKAGIQAPPEDFMDKWTAILTELESVRKAAKILLTGKSGATIAKASDGELIINFENPRFVETFNKANYATDIALAAKNVLGHDISVTATSGESVEVSPVNDTPNSSLSKSSVAEDNAMLPSVERATPESPEPPSSPETTTDESTFTPSADDEIVKEGVDAVAAFTQMFGATVIDK